MFGMLHDYGGFVHADGFLIIGCAVAVDVLLQRAMFSEFGSSRDAFDEVAAQ
jgi:hypothetical protein